MGKTGTNEGSVSDLKNKTSHDGLPGTIDAFFSGKAVRWADFVSGAQVVSEESESSDSDFEPNPDSILSSSAVSARWFHSLSSGRLFKLLIEVIPYLDPCPSDWFAWESTTTGINVDSFPYYPHLMYIRGGGVGPVSDRVSLYLWRKWKTRHLGEMVISLQVKGKKAMQVLHFWQLDSNGLTWIHRGTARSDITRQHLGGA